MNPQPQANTLKNLDEVRAMIKRHKLNDYIFSIIGLLCLMVGFLTLLTLFIDLILSGYAILLSASFYTDFPSRRADSAGLLSALVGSSLVMLVTF
ncbi:MAG: hypothetical protein Q8Q93_22530, partial [Hydrogenophaga sp.]|nr:hypothetical protein [Hydrogenophaga sp.]